jgi:hypothetical protein
VKEDEEEVVVRQEEEDGRRRRRARTWPRASATAVMKLGIASPITAVGAVWSEPQNSNRDRRNVSRRCGCYSTGLLLPPPLRRCCCCCWWFWRESYFAGRRMASRHRGTGQRVVRPADAIRPQAARQR